MRDTMDGILDGKAAPALIKNPNDLASWAGAAKPGEAIVYYRGFLYNDRRGRKKIRDLADFAYMIAQSGAINIVQRRHGFHDYEYIAQKR